MRAVGPDPGEANRRGSPFFLTLEIVSSGERIPGPGTVRRVARRPRDRRGGSAGPGPAADRVRSSEPGLLRAETSLPISFPLLEGAQSVQPRRDDFRGLLLVSPELSRPCSQRTKGHRSGGSPEGSPRPLPGCSTHRGPFLLVPGGARLPHTRRDVIPPRRAPAPLRFRLLAGPREFERVLQRRPL